MRAGLRPDRRSARLGRAHRIGPLGGGDMEDHHRLVGMLGEAAHPLDRLDLCGARVRGGVEPRRGLARRG